MALGPPLSAIDEWQMGPSFIRPGPTKKTVSRCSNGKVLVEYRNVTSRRAERRYYARLVQHVVGQELASNGCRFRSRGARLRRASWTGALRRNERVRRRLYGSDDL